MNFVPETSETADDAKEIRINVLYREKEVYAESTIDDRNQIGIPELQDGTGRGKMMAKTSGGGGGRYK